MSIISDSINNTSSESAIIAATRNFVENNTTPVSLATKIFKNSINAGEAIVNVLGSTGIAGFKFNIPEYELIKLRSEATDNYIDTNVAVQDHITRKPVTVTLKGLQGEYFYSVNQIEDMLAKVVPTLSLVKQFIPKLPTVTQKKIAKKYTEVTGKELTKNNSFLSKEPQNLNGLDLFKLFQEIYKLKSSQTRAFLFFNALWESEALLTVETTWKRYDNMLITDVDAVRDKNADITDFSVSFKQLDFTQSLYRSLDNAIGRTRQQLSQLADKGLDKGKEVNTV